MEVWAGVERVGAVSRAAALRTQPDGRVHELALGMFDSIEEHLEHDDEDEGPSTVKVARP